MRYFSNIFFLCLFAGNLLFAGVLLLSAYSPYVHPTAHPVWACLGLPFPIFLFVNVGFLLFWLVVRRFRAALLSLLAGLLCMSQVRTYLPMNRGEEKLPEKYIRLLSYNVMGFDNTRKVNGKNPMLTYLQESGADIICLQEYATLTANNHLSQRDVERALKEYPYRRINQVGQMEGYTNQLACYSKYPILSAHPLEYKSACNGSVLYRIKVGKDTVAVINNHFESNKLTDTDKAVYKDMLTDPEKEKVKSATRLLLGKLAEAAALRAPQADTVAAVIASLRTPYLIVCGDFNDTPISYTHRVLTERLDDAFVEAGSGLGISYHRNYFYFRIDNILISRNLKAYGCRVDRSIRDSDHYPIVCNLAPRKQEERANE